MTKRNKLRWTRRIKSRGINFVFNSERKGQTESINQQSQDTQLGDDEGEERELKFLFTNRCPLCFKHHLLFGIENVSFFILRKIFLKESATIIFHHCFTYLLLLTITRVLSSDWDTIPGTSHSYSSPNVLLFGVFSIESQDTLNENRIIDKLMFPFDKLLPWRDNRKVQNTKETVNCFSLYPSQRILKTFLQKEIKTNSCPSHFLTIYWISSSSSDNKNILIWK